MEIPKPLKLSEEEITALKREKKSLRAWITFTYGRFGNGNPVDVDQVSQYFDRAQAVQHKLYCHFLALDKDDEAEEDLQRHQDYAKWVREMRQAAKPLKVELCKVKLPEVKTKDPESWMAFRRMYETALEKADLPEDEKMMQILSALPCTEKILVKNLKSDEAIKLLIDHFESPTALIDLADSEFERLPAMIFPTDYKAWKTTRDFLEKFSSMAEQTEVREHVFNRVFDILPPKACLDFTDTYKGSNELGDLASFIQSRLRCIQKLNSRRARKPFKTSLDTTRKEKDRREPKRRDKVHVVESSCSESESEDEKNKNFDSYRSDVRYWSTKEEDMLIWATSRGVNDKSGLRDDINIKAVIGGKPLCLKYDTAAAEVLVPASLFPGYEMNRKFWSASKHVIRAAGPIVMDMVVNGKTFPVKAYVNEANLAILGKPFTNRCSTISDGTTTRKVTLHLRDEDIVVYSKLAKQKKRMRIRPLIRSAGDVWSVLPCASESDLEEDSDEVQVRAKPIESPKLAKLLEKWKYLGEGLGDTDVVTHRIYLKKNAKPVNCRSRRFPVKSMEKAQALIDEMLKLAVIEDSHSEWASAPLPVPKKDGSIRLAIDFRQVNEQCQGDAYPMKRIDEIVEKLFGANIFSKIDLVKGYYQVRIHPKDRHITAFRFGKKLYQFRRMPFGLNSAPQTFQRLMNKVLEDLPFAECYLDDVVIFSANLEEHLQHLEQVFCALKKANLRFNPSKCEFAVQEIEYLGFKICRNRRSPTTDKVQAILNYPKPSTKC